MPQAAKWACPEQLHFITHITWAGTPCNGGNDVMSVMSVMVGEDSALSLGADKECPTARAPGAGGCKGLILLRPLNAGRRLFPRKATCGWFWYFCHQKYRESRDDVAGVLYLFSAKRYPKTPRQMPAHPTCRLNAGFGRPPKRRVLGGCANIHKTGVLRRRSRF